MNHIAKRPFSNAATPAHGDYIQLESGRVDWVDCLKGFCILLVVMLHAVFGVEKAAGAEGWMHAFVTTVQPIRMPAFFLASGLFLMRGIDAPLVRFADRKILHFAYFYVLWLTIQFAFKAPGMVQEAGITSAIGAYALAFVQPFGTLWFIYILPIFYLATRLSRPVAVPVVLACAVLLQVLPIHTGAMIIDEFASYFLWFYLGYAFSDRAFALAAWAAKNPVPAVSGAVVVVACTGLLTQVDVPMSALPAPMEAAAKVATLPLSMMPVVSLLLGLLGTAALIAISAVLAGRSWVEPIRWCGAHSIVIYLAFFLPMAVTRSVLLKLGIISDIGTVSLLVWIAAVAGPVILFWCVERTGLGRFLFERPHWAKLEKRQT
ncbi:MAG: acyltransferase family protein [Alphaproteobacteria bacterium]|nr:acyltransferase family protein [Alphaproteobacteria bacterium]